MICIKVMQGLKDQYQFLVLFLLAISPWLVLFSNNIYWVVPLMLAPAWLGWMFYPRFKSKIYWFYIILGGLFLLKFLAGYEYAPTITVSAMCPVLWYELKNKTSLKKIVKKLGFVISAALIGMTLALLVNWAQVSHYVGSKSEAVKIMKSRGSVRTLSLPDNIDVGQTVLKHLQDQKPNDFEYLENTLNISKNVRSGAFGKIWINGIVAYQYLASPAINLPITLSYPFSFFVASAFSFIVFAIWIAVRQFRKYGKNLPYKDTLATITILSLLGSLAWFVTGYAHSVIHTHLNSIVFYLTFLPFAYVLLARQLQNFIESRPADK
jgi:hypothetical protein